MSELEWIKHDGGPMPVPGDTVVVVGFSDGRCDEELEASYWHDDRDDYSNWVGHDGAAITEYAIVNPSPSTNDPVTRDEYAPGNIDAHYRKMGIEPLEYSMANSFDAMQHTIIKYVSRFRDKNGIRDLYAAKNVLDMLIEREQASATD